MLLYVILVVVSLCLSAALTPGVRVLARRVKAIDQPGGRKIHMNPTPRLGGLSIVCSGVLTVLTVLGFEYLVGIPSMLPLKAWMPGLLGGAVVLLTGVWDDIWPIPASVKFGFQVVAAAVTIWLGGRFEYVSLFGSGSIDLGWVSVPLTAIWLIGITNAFNLVDGLDGLATGLSIITACSSAAILFLLGDLPDAILLLILIGALLGFLPYNFHPATIFLGDSGSMFIGYILAFTVVSGTQNGPAPLAVIVPLLIFGLPIADTLLSMTRRFVRGMRVFRDDVTPWRDQLQGVKSMFQADQRHIHHRLLGLGFSHRNAVLFLYVTALGLSLLAFFSVLAQYHNVSVILVVVGLATYIGIRKLGYDELTFIRTGTLLHWYDRVTFNRRFFLGFVDVVLISIAYWGAFVLKYNGLWVADLMSWYLYVFPFVLMIQLVVFHTAGLYRGVWRAAEISDLVHVAWTALLAVAVSFILTFLYTPPFGLQSFLGIDALLLGALMVSVRSTYRILDYIRQQDITPEGTALIYGAGRGGQLILRELLQNPRSGLRPIGFLDDETSLHGRMVNRIPVLGSINDLRTILARQPVSALVIASSHIQEHRVRQAISVCQTQGVSILQGCIQLIPLGTNGIPRTRLTMPQSSEG